MSKDWVLVYNTPLVYMGDVVKAFLAEENIASFIVNKKDSMHIHLSIGEIEVYVQPEDVINAKYLISKNEL